MEITKNEITRTEKILLPESKTFDDQRIDVIKCFETRDIKACPGSGKSTALVSKLIILSEKMPFKDGRGICVLTHTNVAINEIKNKLGSKSDILFNYPNHFGTFQSFVDKFLAIPAYIYFFQKRQKCIDNEIYNYKAENFSHFNAKNLNNNKAKQWLHRNNNISNIRFSYNQKKTLIDIKKGKEISLNKKDENESNIYDWIIEFKSDLIKEKGILTFEEAYTLANRYLIKFPILKDAFQRRFKYVFVDEMQDSDFFQDDIINTLFTDKQSTVIQKYGDPNQAIYDKKVKKEIIWTPNNPLPISNSKRFGESIAKRLKTICIEYNENLNGDPSINSQIPHIIIFNYETILKVINTFSELIHKYKLDEYSDNEVIRPFKAIGWVGKEREENETDKLCIRSYFPKYNKIIRQRRTNFNNLISYLRKQSREIIGTCGAKIYRDSILNALVKIIDECGIKNVLENKEIYFTPTSFLIYLRNNVETEYIELRNRMADWIKKIQNNKEEYSNDILKLIQKYIKETFPQLWSNFSCDKVKDFIEDENPEINVSESKENNFYQKDFLDTNTSIDIEITTIHSVKGETHKATLYLETHYYKHESEKIMEFLKGNYNTNSVQAQRINEALKMGYVGMSRPTHLLCLAIHEDRIKEHVKDLDIENNPNGWKIIDLANNLK